MNSKCAKCVKDLSKPRKLKGELLCEKCEELWWKENQRRFQEFVKKGKNEFQLP